MTTPRHRLVDSQTPLFYHLVSRCVRHGWLCGYDQVRRKDYSHRKKWIVDRIHQLGQAFAVEIHAYAVMSNHFHLVVYYDPTANQSWDDEEVVDRWLSFCFLGRQPEAVRQQAIFEARKRLLEDPNRISRLRDTLGSLSMFMKHLKQPIARRANLEDETTGNFFDRRYYSGALLNQEAVLAAMAYVDLNPIRAKIARTLEESAHTSVHERLTQTGINAPPEKSLAPLATGLTPDIRIHTSTEYYLTHLHALTTYTRQEENHKLKRWRAHVALLKRRQRVFGSMTEIRAWVSSRGLQPRDKPLMG